MGEARFEPRTPHTGAYSLTWRTPDGHSHSAEAVGVDLSRSGVGLDCPVELRPGAIVYLEARDGAVEGECEVVHCTQRGARFLVGFELREGHTRPHASVPEQHDSDYYEVLQISRKADLDTVRRVFRIMAARFHPDNTETGDLETFLRMKRAYGVLSDPARRAQYDAHLEQARDHGPRRIFGLKDFVTGVEAETNRRLGVLCLLYSQRQTDPDHPSISLLSLEQEMGFPREYLSFTMWYLRAKEYVLAADNGDYAISAAGAEYVEKKAGRNELVGKLLRPGHSGVNPKRSPKASRPRLMAPAPIAKAQ